MKNKKSFINNKRKRINLIIDTDPGIDDAVAIAHAFASKKLNIKMMAAVFGNISVETTTKNILRLLDLFRQKIKTARQNFIFVAKGANVPMGEEFKDKPVGVHGTDGLGELNFHQYKYSADDIDNVVISEDIATTYFKLIRGTYGFKDDKIVIMCIGPLTNVACFLKRYPKLARERVSEIVFMGGSLDEGPITVDGEIVIPYTGFNVNMDPEAVRIVLESGIKFTMVPMEHGHNAHLTPVEIEKGAKISSLGRVFAQIFPNYKDRHVKQPNIATHDLATMIYLTEPKLLTIKPAGLSVVASAKGEHAVAIDFNGQINAQVATDIDVEKVRKLYLKMLRKYK